jgi:predicted MFS family arabinose efflux permease
LNTGQQPRPSLRENSPHTGKSADKEPLFTGSFILLLTAALTLYTGMGVFYLFPLFVLEIGGNKADIGILMGAMSLAGVCSRPWVSGLVDRIGRKRSLVISCLILMTVSAIHMFVRGPIDQIFMVLVLLRLVFGAGLSLAIVAGITMAADLSPASRLTESIGYFGITPLLGIAFGPLLAEVLVQRWGFNAIFYSALFFFIAALLILQPLRDQFTHATDAAKSNFFKVLRTPIVWRMAMICLCFGAAFAAHSSFIAPFAQQYDLSVAAYFASYSTAAVLARIFGGYIVYRFGELRVMPAALMIGSIGFLCLIGVSTSIGLAGTGFLAGMGHGLLFPSLIAITIRPLAAGDWGKVNGVLTGGFDSGMFIGALIMGQLAELYGFSIIFATAAGTIFIGLGIFLRIRPTIVHR